MRDFDFEKRYVTFTAWDPNIWDLAHFLVIQGLNTVKFMKSLSKQGKESIPQVLSDIFEIYRKK